MGETVGDAVLTSGVVLCDDESLVDGRLPPVQPLASTATTTATTTGAGMGTGPTGGRPTRPGVRLRTYHLAVRRGRVQRW